MKSHLLDYAPLYILLALFVLMTIAYIVGMNDKNRELENAQHTAYEEVVKCLESEACKVIVQTEGNRSDKERCLDEARNMIQAWRCK